MVEASTLDTSRPVLGMPLLATKLYMPRARPGPVPRPRLTDRLNQGLHSRLILISAPAGFGKTTLLSEWRTIPPASELSFAWVSLDDGDNDPARFWSYVITALQRIHPDIGKDVLPALQSLQPPPADAILPLLINDVAALTSDFVLVLDDYHAIHNDTIHHSLVFLVEHLPPQLHLVVASRTDPPLPLTLLRGRGQLTELRTDDLRFTAQEASEFLQRVMGLDLTAEQLAVLEERTEGWIAGLQMAALSMQGAEDVAGFVQAFRGDDRHILDYLVEQVLARQPEEVQAFLLQTSILNRMCGPLCEAVTEQPNGQATLEALERGNLFVIPLDNKRQWYRYHHLFADVLRMRLPQAHLGQTAELHRRASAWYEAHGLLEKAVEHALAAQDFEMAARLAGSAIAAVRTRREFGTVLSWLAALPEAVVQARPRLGIEWSDLLVFTGQLAAAEVRLQWAENALRVRDLGDTIPEADTLYLLEHIFFLRMHIAAQKGEVARLQSLYHQALATFPDDPLWRARIEGHAGFAYYTAGDLAEAERLLARAIPHIQTEPALRAAPFNFDSLQLGTEILGWIYEEQGHLRQALETQQRNLQVAIEDGERAAPWAVRAHSYIFRLLYERNDLDAASHHLQKQQDILQQLNVANEI